MKYFAWVVIFLLLISSVSYYLMNDIFGSEELYYDDDQEGLNEQIVIRFSHVVAENTPKGLAAQKFAEIVYAKSQGRVRVEVFPNGALASDNEEFTRLLQNDIQMIAPSFSKMTDIAPEWAVFDLPFLFNDFEDVGEAFTGEIGDYLLQSLHENNVKGLSLWSNGFKQMTSNQKQITLPEDFENQSFRIMPSWVIAEQFQLFKASSIVIPFNEVYDSLESLEVDGQENTISNIYSRSWHELQRFMTISNHGYLGYAVIINGDFWDQLPKEIKTMLTEAMVETTKWNLQQSKEINIELLREIEKNSDMEIHYLTEEEKQLWKEKLRPIYQIFKEKANPQLANLVENMHE